MPRTEFDALPDDARLWVFSSSRPLAPDESEALLTRVDGFLDGWNAHGHPLTGAREWREHRFLLVAVDEASAPPSGCSIDALHRILKEYEASRGVGMTDHADVLYRDGDGAVRSAPRLDFARMAKAGEVGLDTPVFDTTLTRKADLATAFEVPATAAWHRRAFWRQLT
ncbi:MAG: hypothetical protein KJP18_05890 [Gemmatimonadetes bacterium]|nr:hypothetical protein [Gemmatimonadota bacterium]